MPYCSKLAFQKYTNKSSKSFISNTSSQKCARLLKAFLYSFTHTSTKYKRTCLFVSIVFYYTIIASLFAFAFRSTQKSKVIQIAGLSFESYITHVRGESFQSIINPFVKNYLSKPQIEFSFPRYAAIHSICMSENGVSIFNLFESNTYNLQLKTIKEARVRITKCTISYIWHINSRFIKVILHSLERKLVHYHCCYFTSAAFLFFFCVM